MQVVNVGHDPRSTRAGRQLIQGVLLSRCHCVKLGLSHWGPLGL